MDNSGEESEPGTKFCPVMPNLAALDSADHFLLKMRTPSFQFTLVSSYQQLPGERRPHGFPMFYLAWVPVGEVQGSKQKQDTFNSLSLMHAVLKCWLQQSETDLAKRQQESWHPRTP